MGRIKILIISIKTIKFIRKVGVPWGTRWIRKLFVFLIIPNNKVLNHKVIANNIFKVTWEVLGKFWGKRAITFIKRIMKNKVIAIEMLPFLLDIINFISCLIFFKIAVMGCFLMLLIFFKGNKKKSKDKAL
jgi:hypothetical protein